jgi:flagellar hook protein FlgE
MSANQNWLSSISQNVANSTTTGYKGIETEFSTMVDQAPGGPYNSEGVQTTTISYNALQGGVVSSATATNLAVQGAGFFVVSDSAGNLYLTRNGSFVPDSSGNLINSSGFYLMADDIRNNQTPTANSLSSLSKVNVESSGLTAEATTEGSLAVNLPSAATPTAFVAPTSTTPATCTDQTSLVAYDDLGGAHTVNLYFTKTGAAGDGAWEVDAYEGTTQLMTPQTLQFSATNGAVTSGSPLTFSVAGGQSVSVDLSNTTQLATSFSVTSATDNGSSPATLQGVSTATDGKLSYIYSNGESIAAYDIPLANVASPDNLSSVNGGAYTATAASGPIFLGTAGSTLGTIKSSSLESSTVDLATELTDMIQAQSAYEANSKVFQTGATLLDVLNNLKS